MAAYVSGPFLKPGPDPYRDFDADIDSYLRAGFRAIKMRMGIAPRTDGERLRRVRERVGADFPLMVDLNEGASLRERARLRRGVPRVADLVWLEEPIATRQSRRLRAAVARAADGTRRRRVAVRPRRVPRLRRARRAGDRRSPTSRCAADSAKRLRIAALCEAFEVPLVPHVWGTGINFCAALAVRGNPSAVARARFRPTRCSSSTSSHNPLRDAFGSFAVRPDGTVADASGTRDSASTSTPIRFEPYVTAQLDVEA